MASVFNFINSAFSAVGTWFYDIFEATNMTEFVLAILFCVYGYKFILAPVLGTARGSDHARSSKDQKKEG